MTFNKASLTHTEDVSNPSRPHLTLMASEQELGRHELLISTETQTKLSSLNEAQRNSIKSAHIDIEVGIDATQHGFNQLYDEPKSYWQDVQNGLKMLLQKSRLPGSKQVLTPDQINVANEIINFKFGANFDSAAALFAISGDVRAKMGRARKIDSSFSKLHGLIYSNRKTLFAMNIPDDFAGRHDLLSMALACNRASAIYDNFLSNAGVTEDDRDRNEGTFTIKIKASSTKHSPVDRYAKLEVTYTEIDVNTLKPEVIIDNILKLLSGTTAHFAMSTLTKALAAKSLPIGILPSLVKIFKSPKYSTMLKDEDKTMMGTKLKSMLDTPGTKAQSLTQLKALSGHQNDVDNFITPLIADVLAETPTVDELDGLILHLGESVKVSDDMLGALEAQLKKIEKAIKTQDAIEEDPAKILTRIDARLKRQDIVKGPEYILPLFKNLAEKATTQEQLLKATEKLENSNIVDSEKVTMQDTLDIKIDQKVESYSDATASKAGIKERLAYYKTLARSRQANIGTMLGKIGSGSGEIVLTAVQANELETLIIGMPEKVVSDKSNLLLILNAKIDESISSIAELNSRLDAYNATSFDKSLQIIGLLNRLFLTMSSPGILDHPIGLTAGSEFAELKALKEKLQGLNTIVLPPASTVELFETLDKKIDENVSNYDQVIERLGVYNDGGEIADENIALVVDKALSLPLSFEDLNKLEHFVGIIPDGVLTSSKQTELLEKFRPEIDKAVATKDQLLSRLDAYKTYLSSVSGIDDIIRGFVARVTPVVDPSSKVEGKLINIDRSSLETIKNDIKQIQDKVFEFASASTVVGTGVLDFAEATRLTGLLDDRVDLFINTSDAVAGRIDEYAKASPAVIKDAQIKALVARLNTDPNKIDATDAQIKAIITKIEACPVAVLTTAIQTELLSKLEAKNDAAINTADGVKDRIAEYGRMSVSKVTRITALVDRLNSSAANKIDADEAQLKEIRAAIKACGDTVLKVAEKDILLEGLDKKIDAKIDTADKVKVRITEYKGATASRKDAITALVDRLNNKAGAANNIDADEAQLKEIRAAITDCNAPVLEDRDKEALLKGLDEKIDAKIDTADKVRVRIAEYAGMRAPKFAQITALVDRLNSGAANNIEADEAQLKEIHTAITDCNAPVLKDTEKDELLEGLDEKIDAKIDTADKVAARITEYKGGGVLKTTEITALVEKAIGFPSTVPQLEGIKTALEACGGTVLATDKKTELLGKLDAKIAESKTPEVIKTEILALLPSSKAALDPATKSKIEPLLLALEKKNPDVALLTGLLQKFETKIEPRDGELEHKLTVIIEGKLTEPQKASFVLNGLKEKFDLSSLGVPTKEQFNEAFDKFEGLPKYAKIHAMPDLLKLQLLITLGVFDTASEITYMRGAVKASLDNLSELYKTTGPEVIRPDISSRTKPLESAPLFTEIEFEGLASRLQLSKSSDNSALLVSVPTKDGEVLAWVKMEDPLFDLVEHQVNAFRYVTPYGPDYFMYKLLGSESKDADKNLSKARLNNMVKYVASKITDESELLSKEKNPFLNMKALLSRRKNDFKKYFSTLTLSDMGDESQAKFIIAMACQSKSAFKALRANKLIKGKLDTLLTEDFKAKLKGINPKLNI